MNLIKRVNIKLTHIVLPKVFIILIPFFCTEGYSDSRSNKSLDQYLNHQKYNSIKIMALIKKGANVNYMTKKRMTPLIMSVFKRDKRLLIFLLLSSICMSSLGGPSTEVEVLIS